ncbi:uncharacterized protein [Epargyreus clarus]|uniref:uncharacterized protein isoform X2 n=1 Tax=Epargyreus clarus TaxID=520877 RepID=UPI003C2F81FB
MSSDGSVSSGISQFGLYRTIDARTEEFLKLSKKRQIRQGCVCAAISTAITVTVVVIVLLIYEYMIVVETSIVQNRRNLKRNNKTIALNDHPIADRLDRSYFGFDQEYYERMPLLVNALQENSYMDPSTEIFESAHKKRRFPDIRNIRLTTENYRAIRRTSPRPFLYEYKNPEPAPFSKSHTKAYASRSWVESYRNAQRLKNLNEIIKYLERTLNAKFGDVKTQTSTRIAFSGIYMEPFADEHKETEDDDIIAHSSNTHEFRSNHQFDPLYTFKPDHPGEINLLAEGLRFGPASSMHFVSEILPTVPIFRPIPNRKRNCFGDSCNDNEKTNIKLSSTTSDENTDIKNVKSFGVMLNLYPLHTTKSTDTISSSVSTPTELDKIYITTSRPMIQFRRKSSFPVRRTSIGSRRRFSSKVKHNKNNISNSKSHDIESTTIPKMIVHVNVYSVKKEIEKTENVTETLYSTTQNDFSTPLTTSTFKPIIDDYRVLNSSHVEDFHVGSSGIIPVEERTTSTPPPTFPSTFPIVTPIVPLYDTTAVNYEAPRTEPPDVIRFSPEDARIPDQYLNIRKTDGRQLEVTEITPNYDEPVENKQEDIEARTLVVKLKNYDSSRESNVESTENNEEVTQTYVPQLNGHYRNLIHKSLSTLLRENSEKYRRKLENSVPSIRKSSYVPMYVEIKRNYTRTQIDDND